MATAKQSVVVTGPESSGKSTLVERLSSLTGRNPVPEYARSYLTPGQTYLPSDLLKIAAQQMLAETKADAATDAGIVADTDIQVVSIWWQYRFGPLPQKLQNAYLKQSPRFYLLCSPDLPWEADPLRENPSDRQQLFYWYAQDLTGRGLRFAVVQGHGDERLHNALEALKQHSLWS